MSTGELETKFLTDLVHFVKWGEGKPCCLAFNPSLLDKFNWSYEPAEVTCSFCHEQIAGIRRMLESLVR